jgi:hypothetical protein
LRGSAGMKVFRRQYAIIYCLAQFFLSNDAGKNEKCGRIPVVSVILVFFIIQLKY